MLMTVTLKFKFLILCEGTATDYRLDKREDSGRGRPLLKPFREDRIIPVNPNFVCMPMNTHTHMHRRLHTHASLCWHM